MTDNHPAAQLLKTLWSAAQGDERELGRVRFVGEGELPSAFAVTDLAAASMGAAGLALCALLGANTQANVTVDRRLASFWFAQSLRPKGWRIENAEDFVMGDYPAVDGWIRLHTNALHHRAAALRASSIARASSTPTVRQSTPSPASACCTASPSGR